MSQLIARILLAIFVIPIGSLVYLVTFLKCESWFGRMMTRQTYTYRQIEHFQFFLTGMITWTFVGAWWFLLWRKFVQWNGARLYLTGGCVLVSAIVGLVLAASFDRSERASGDLVGSAAAPLLWLVGTIFAWRETAAERAVRVNSSGRDVIVCPKCGYNLTGLKESHCPECGSQFTLDQLLAAQPARAQEELED